MNHYSLVLASVGISCILSACAGVSIVATADPLQKLNDAEVLYMQKNRPLPAETLIIEAKDLYRQRSDPRGMGNSFREYADLLKSPAVQAHEAIYRRDGFRDKSITFDNRNEKAREFYATALSFYETAEPQARSAERYDDLTNLYYNMAYVNSSLGQNSLACTQYDQSLQAYEKNLQRNPSLDPKGLAHASASESIATAKKRIGCS